MISFLLFSLFIRVFIGRKIGVCAPIWVNLLIFGYVHQGFGEGRAAEGSNKDNNNNTVNTMR